MARFTLDITGEDTALDAAVPLTDNNSDGYVYIINGSDAVVEVTLQLAGSSLTEWDPPNLIDNVNHAEHVNKTNVSLRDFTVSGTQNKTLSIRGLQPGSFAVYPYDTTGTGNTVAVSGSTARTAHRTGIANGQHVYVVNGGNLGGPS